MRTILMVGCAFISIVALVLMAILLFDKSNAVTIAAHGTIVYPEPRPTYIEPSSSFTWYQIVKEATYYIFGFLSAIGGIIKILEYRKHGKARAVQIVQRARKMYDIMDRQRAL